MSLTQDQINVLTNGIMEDLNTLRILAPVEAANVLVSIETFVAIALRVFAKTNPSKLRDVMRTVEIQARIDHKEVV